MKALIVTGTDTGVGKTTIAAALCAYLSLKMHINVGVMKPFESGLPKEEDAEQCRDSVLLRRASGCGDTIQEINPYTFEAPLSPEAAAHLENVSINLEFINEAYEKLRARHTVLVAEGAGGVLVPIKKGFFFSDLMKLWRAPTVVVARLGLGTINHTLLTTRFLQSEGINVAGVILNDTEKEKDPSCETNPAALREYLNVPLLGIFPRLGDEPCGNMNREYLADVFARNVDTDRIMKTLGL